MLDYTGGKEVVCRCGQPKDKIVFPVGEKLIYPIRLTAIVLQQPSAVKCLKCPARNQGLVGIIPIMRGSEGSQTLDHAECQPTENGVEKGLAYQIDSQKSTFVQVQIGYFSEP